MNLKRQLIVISIFFGIITLILILVFIYPLFKGAKLNSLELISVKKELALFQDKAGGIEKLKTTYKKIEPDLEKIDQLFIDSEVPVNLIEFLEKTAKGSGLLIKISPTSLKPVEQDLWNSITFRLTLIGSFTNFLRFLEKTEASAYLIEIQDLFVKRLTEPEAFEGVRTTLIIKVYAKD